MKIKRMITNSIIVLLLFLGCKKEFISKPITIEAMSNIQINYFRYHNSCDSSPYYLNFWGDIEDQGNENYQAQIPEGYDELCFTVSGEIPANSDTVGKTVISVEAFYSEEGNVCGFFDLELDRPHGANSYALEFQFRADTYLE